MSSNEFISSGILESYVLGVASPEERKEVEKQAALYPEIKSELESIEKAMHAYVTKHSMQPPAHLKEEIIAKITGQATEAKIRSINQPNNFRFSYWFIAATFLLLISASFATYFALKVNKLNDTMYSFKQTNAVLTDSLKTLSANLGQMQNDMSILKDPMYKIVELKGLKVAPQAKAMVCWCPTDKKVYVEIDNLPPTPQGMEYQLWAIVDGKPVSEGMLTIGNGLHAMKDVDNAQAFAVTLEKQGGSPEPKGDMYVMGTI